MSKTICPMCAGSSFVEGWFSLQYLDRQFQFPQCRDCGSLICDPMPDAEMLVRMYDESYLETGNESGDEFVPTKFDEVVEYIRSLPPGRLIDYGCGEGQLLIHAKNLGWDVTGIDFNPQFASELREQGIEVIGHDAKVDNKADVVHLGDVLEHLTEMDAQFPEILKLVKNGGLLISHGPLEGNPNLFFRLLKLGKRLRGNRSTIMAPYHVILATSRGQRQLFKRFGLIEEEFRVKEVAFPAPAKFRLDGLRSPRWTGLFAARKLSQLTSSLNMDGLGNRYFYVGRKPSTQK